jgi:hypothetical protein
MQRTWFCWAGLIAGLMLSNPPAAKAIDYADHFGISIGAPVYLGQVTFTEQVAQDLAEIGITWIRVEFIAAGDSINYTQYDEIINRANAYGINVLGLLTYQSKFYGGNSSQWADDTWQDSFRDRCVEIVNHYRDFPSGPIRFWEVWNEPDSLGYIVPDKFGRMMSICYPAIKNADPRATVILAGLTGYWTPTYTYMRSVYQSSYFNNYHAQNGIYPFDILGQHPYDWTSNPLDYLEIRLNGVLGTKRLMSLYGDDYKRIWFTEYGWNSSTTANSSINPGGQWYFNEWLQGEFFDIGFDITQTLDYGDGYGPYAEKTFLFQYKDFELGTPETTEYFGVVTQSSDIKPLYYRVRRKTAGVVRNLALQASVSASDELPPNELAEYACDGTPFTKWTALTPVDDHTLTLDLGGWYEVHEFALAHAEMGHEPDIYNTAAFEIQSAPDLDGPWTTLALVNNMQNEPVNRITLPQPQVLRHLRLWITDAGTADGIARLPEFEVYGRDVTDPAVVLAESEFATDLAGANGLSQSIATDDLISGQLAVFESGDVDIANEVFAYQFSSGNCLEMTVNPVTGFWAGYGDPSPSAHVAKFTDGSDLEGVVLSDFARAAAVLRYDFAAPTDLREIAIFAANPSKDGRVFQHYDAYVSSDGGVTYALLKREVTSGSFGDDNPGLYGASLTRLTRPLTGTLAEAATQLRLVFYDVAIGDKFHDPWQGLVDEGGSYPTSCPFVDSQDIDGLRKAFGSPILMEIDVFERPTGDGDADGTVTWGDGLALLDKITGPDNGPLAPGERTYDAWPRDDDIDLADAAVVQASIE